jgi:hypothetical protein
VNAFTNAIVISGAAAPTITTIYPIQAAAGTASIPSFAFTDDADGTGTGLYRGGANAISVAVNGVQTMQFNASTFALLNSASFQMTSAAGTTFLKSVGSEVLGVGGSGAAIINAGNGSASAPTYSFTNDSNTGMYTDASDGLSFAAGGAIKFAWKSGQLNILSSGQIGFSSGADPLSGAVDTGIFRSAAGVLGVQGVSGVAGRLAIADGTPGTNCAIGFSSGACITATSSPAFDFGTTAAGWMGITGTTVVIPTGSQFVWSSGTIRAAGPDTGIARGGAGFVRITNGSSGDGTLRVGDGNSTTPGYAFTGETNSGLFRSGGANLVMAVTGSNAVFFTTGGIKIPNSAVKWCTGAGCSVTDTSLLRATNGAGLRVTNDAFTAPLFISQAVELIANTATATPGATDSGRLYTNTGDGDGSSVTLPNDPTAGSCFEGAVTVAQNFDFTPSSGESIRDGASTGTTRIRSSTIGDTIRLCAVSGGSGAEWRVMSKTGTWTLS